MVSLKDQEYGWVKNDTTYASGHFWRIVLPWPEQQDADSELEPLCMLLSHPLQDPETCDTNECW